LKAQVYGSSEASVAALFIYFVDRVSDVTYDTGFKGSWGERKPTKAKNVQK